MPKLSLWHSCLNLPSLTAPVFCRKLCSGFIAPVARSKTLASRRNIFLDRHVGIAEAHQLYNLAFFREHSRLLRSARCFLWDIVTTEFFAVIFHNYSFGKAYHPSGMVILLDDLTVRPDASRVHTLTRTVSARRTG